jgi:ubiquinone/menaquinone biosynthesis C-methylase UbiE
MEDQNRIAKASKVLKILESQVSLKDGRVLEIGCFTGRFSEVFSGKVSSFVGIDIDSNAVTIAKKRNLSKNVRFEMQNCEDMTFSDSSFEIVICNHIYEHTPNPAQMLAEINRVLTPNGICYFSAGNRFQIMEPHHRIWFLSWWPKIISSLILSIKKHRWVKYHENHLSHRELMQLISKFEVRNMTGELLLNPEKYGFETELPPNSFRQFLGKLSYKYLLFFFPTFIFILKKNSTVFR